MKRKLFPHLLMRPPGGHQGDMPSSSSRTLLSFQGAHGSLSSQLGCTFHTFFTFSAMSTFLKKASPFEIPGIWFDGNVSLSTQAECWDAPAFQWDPPASTGSTAATGVKQGSLHSTPLHSREFWFLLPSIQASSGGISQIPRKPLSCMYLCHFPQLHIWFTRVVSLVTLQMAAMPLIPTSVPIGWLVSPRRCFCQCWYQEAKRAATDPGLTPLLHHSPPWAGLPWPSHSTKATTTVTSTAFYGANTMAQTSNSVSKPSAKAAITSPEAVVGLGSPCLSEDLEITLGVYNACLAASSP